MNETRHYAKYPADEVRLPMLDWLHHHGIDPNDVALPGWIERDEAARRICYEAYALDERGRPYLDETGDTAAREVRIVQLEAAPTPFPIPE